MFGGEGPSCDGTVVLGGLGAMLAKMVEMDNLTGMSAG